MQCLMLFLVRIIVFIPLQSFLILMLFGGIFIFLLICRFSSFCIFILDLEGIGSCHVIFGVETGNLKGIPVSSEYSVFSLALLLLGCGFSRTTCVSRDRISSTALLASDCMPGFKAFLVSMVCDMAEYI